jgi:hypothetical protein
MAKIYNTAMGKPIDLDSLLLKNEEVIAVGNMKVNARGDELGFGGKIVKTRDQVMKEYYALKSPTASDPTEGQIKTQPVKQQVKVTPVQQAPAPIVADVPPPPEPEAVLVINPDAGLDDMDEGPAIAPVVDKPVEEVLAAPVPVVPPVAPVQAFVPKAVSTGTPVAKPVQEKPVAVVEKAVAMPAPPAEPPAMRGTLASAVRSETTVTQKPLLPAKKAAGIQRF